MAASYEARALRDPGGMPARRGEAPLPGADRGRPRFDGLRRGEPGGLRGLRATPRRSSRGCRSRRRSSRSAGCERIAGTPRADRSSDCARGSRARSGCRSRSASPGPRSSRRWRAAPPSPTACSSSTPDRERGVPAPAADRADLGRRAVDRGEAPRPRDRDGRRPRGDPRALADRAARHARRAQAPRARALPRAAPGRARRGRALVRLAVARSAAGATLARRSSTRSSRGSSSG